MKDGNKEKIKDKAVIGIIFSRFALEGSIVKVKIITLQFFKH